MLLSSPFPMVKEPPSTVIAPMFEPLRLIRVIVPPFSVIAPFTSANEPLAMRKQEKLKLPSRISAASGSTRKAGPVKPFLNTIERPLPSSVSVMVLPDGIVTVPFTMKLLFAVMVVFSVAASTACCSVVASPSRMFSPSTVTANFTATPAGIVSGFESIATSAEHASI